MLDFERDQVLQVMLRLYIKDKQKVLCVICMLTGISLMCSLYELINFIQQENRILHAALTHTMNEYTRQSPYIRASMTPFLIFLFLV